MEKCIEKAEDHCKSYPRCYGCGAYREPTNADRIRSMSDEELAAWLTHIANGDVHTDFCGNPARTVVCDSKCVGCITEWLKQPVKDGGGE